MILILTGIITEYNPFHKGHEYHLSKAKSDTNADAIVCVMSGNFMQRGIPAIIDKWKRAEMAIKNGVDLVLELPLVYSISSAEHFAFGSVSLLNSLGVIDHLYFGSEEGNVSILEDIAKVLVSEPLRYKKLLKDNLDLGLPFHLSRANALKDYLNSNKLLDTISNSNNILGIEYIKSLIRLNSEIVPKTIKREGSLYNDINISASFASATSIRKHLKEKSLNDLADIIPKASYDILLDLSSSKYPFIFEEDTFKYIKYKLLTNERSLSNLPDVSEGIDNKILKEILRSNSLNELILNSKSKRYTYTRISRILLQSFLNLEDFDLLNLSKSPVPYARVLAFNSTGQRILKSIKTNSSINLITKVPRNNQCDHLKIDILGTKAYSLLNPKVNPMDDYLKGPFIM
ncbi:nucleotidyltransferase [Clostridium sp. 2-1]|uniref:nucleotidyltransferase n=1 Tax=Clostridium TaxID=1485 RepID=UPI000CDA4C17|nr:MULTISPECIES: nucleotidyltransferase [Clostridium]MBN7574764.1 nucleotidyltransferase [Clostridium beijerinckii]MBN7580061.1 nucleotidyltransferase [Clostridium beijerinckii]MBN7584528.1 nucleotidyltransferase [Clostridium beijerinckii]MBO0520266.1 nucleotidyltransferase [Clostridium beijerinckii]POO92195.1 nucleotidyltransferase [Clostridium sp. 2-1]